MKKYLKQLVVIILGWQVRRLRKKNDFKIVAVGGSVGKTSTKLAIAQVLAQKFPVRYQQGNYNDLVSVPLIFFGHKMPSLLNPLAWLRIFIINETIIWKKYPFEIVVVELGSDGPGQLEQFRQYLQADFGILTGISPEHMQFFSDLSAVAKEELVIAQLASEVLVNKDLTDAEYLIDLKEPVLSYGVRAGATYQLGNVKFTNDLAEFEIRKTQQVLLKAHHESVSEPQLLSICAAAAVGDQFGMEPHEIEEGIHAIPPVPGRMRRLAGVNGSTIIDDSYNSSPQATKSALDTLYRLDGSQKIAVLGNMNELGQYSQAAHEEIGDYCDPKQLSLVVTIGPDANQYLAAAAKDKGCQVETFDNPVSAGEHLKPLIKKNAVILVKGSQNMVFSEETVKILLADPADARKLVRQTKQWLKVKRKAFAK